MKPQNRTQRQLRNEFIKSGAILLLAVVLLISVVFAWFGGAEDPTIEPFAVSIKSDVDGVELGEDIVTEKTVILPSATILGHEDISVSDFSKAIKVMPLGVESPLPNDVSISIIPANGLHFYIDTDYDSNVDSAYSYAETITNNYFNDGEGNDTSKILTYLQSDYIEEEKVYNHMVAIVFWADYDYIITDKENANYGKRIGDVINESGLIDFKAIMSFKVVRTEGE